MSIALPATLANRNSWQPVLISKRNEQGEAIKDEQGKIVARHRILDVRTGDFYISENVEKIWVKTVGIWCALPFWTLGQMVWSAGRNFYDVANIAYDALKKIGAEWNKGHGIGWIMENITITFSRDLYCRIAKNICHFISAPFFGSAMLIAATIGIFSPYEGRKQIAQLEYAWQDKVSFKEDCRLQHENPKAFYLAWCFQPRGNVHQGLHFIQKWNS